MSSELPEHLRPRRRGDEIVVLLLELGLLVTAIGVVLFALLGTDGSSPWPGCGGMVFVVLVLAGTRALRRGRARRGGAWPIAELRAKNDAARALLDRDRAEEAERAFEEIARNAGASSAHHAIAVFGVGAARIAQGQPERGVELMEAVLESGWGRAIAMSAQRGVLEAGLASGLALAGEIDRAERWLAEAKRRAPPAHSGRTLYAEALIAARRARWDEAARLESEWTRAENDLALRPRRALRVVIALMRERGGASAEEVDLWLRAIHPLTLGGALHLGARWPEMRAFLAAHGVSA